MCKSLDYALKKCRELPIPAKGQQRLYAVVVDKRGRVVGEGTNHYTKSHPLMQQYSLEAGASGHRCMLHSEVAAIIRSRGKGCKLVVARVGRDGKELLAKPCKSCMVCIEAHGNIKSIEYTIGAMQ